MARSLSTDVGYQGRLQIRSLRISSPATVIKNLFVTLHELSQHRNGAIELVSIVLFDQRGKTGFAMVANTESARNSKQLKD
jgi:hypothetical protein